MLHNHLLVVKNVFLNVYISVHTIFECTYLFFWLRNWPSIKYLPNWGDREGGGGHPKCVQVRTVGEVEKSFVRYVRTK